MDNTDETEDSASRLHSTTLCDILPVPSDKQLTDIIMWLFDEHNAATHSFDYTKELPTGWFVRELVT